MDLKAFWLMGLGFDTGHESFQGHWTENRLVLAGGPTAGGGAMFAPSQAKWAGTPERPPLTAVTASCCC